MLNATYNPSELRRILDQAGLGNVELDRFGNLPALAGEETVPNPVANPLLGPTVNGTEVTIDTLINPPTMIPAIIRNLVAQNQGYFAEDIFATPGFTVEGGAILYEETFPEDYFLPTDQSIGPRAPGSEAPRVGSTRHPLKIARPESWSGSIEVHDEMRRRNNVRAVQRQFTQLANTFANRLQSRAIETLLAFVESSGRSIAGKGWRQKYENGVINVDPQKLPSRDFGLVLAQFEEDKTGVRPDTVILNTMDAFFLRQTYSIFGGIKQLLEDTGITTIRSTPQLAAGTAIFLKRQGVGVMAFEKPLDQEYTREGKRWTDVFSLETVPVYVADDASALLAVTGINAEA